MRFTSEFVTIPGKSVPIRAYLALPIGVERAPAILMYSDIFQLTPSTLRVAARFAGYGFAVLVPEIYARRVPAGTAWAFDDEGRELGMAAAKATTIAEFDEDAHSAIDFLSNHSHINADQLGTVGFCLGGHLAFRASFAPKIKASVCYYPTGVHNGALGKDADAGSLEEITKHKIGRLHLVFGTQDPHVPADGRIKIFKHLDENKIAYQISTYPTEHAFMRDEGPRYDPEATDQAFAAGIATLRG